MDRRIIIVLAAAVCIAAASAWAASPRGGPAEDSGPDGGAPALDLTGGQASGADGDSNATSSNWTVVYYNGETLFNKDKGAKKLDYPIDVPGARNARFYLSVTAHTCGCGGWGEGTLTVTLTDPAGVQHVAQTYTYDAESTFDLPNPAQGRWALSIVGTAVGTDFILGYHCELAVLY